MNMDARTGVMETGYFRRISWGAVFAGVLVALIVQLTLSLLGIAIGLGATLVLDAGRGIAIGAAVWWILITLVSLFVGGWIAGKLCGIPFPFESVLHGIVLWALSIIITVWLLAGTLGAIMGGAFGVLQTAVTGASQVITPQMAEELRAMVAQQDTVSGNIKEEADRILSQNARQEIDMNAARDELESAVDDLLGAEMPAQEERQKVIAVLTQYTTLTQEQANSLVDGWMSRYQQSEAMRMQEGASDIAEQSAKIAAQSALWSFLMLVLGALAAALGAYVGTPTIQEIRRERI
jgi:hypothetical protein